MPRVHWKELVGFNAVAAGIFGFLLVGIVCLGSIGFGVYQVLRAKDSSNSISTQILGEDEGPQGNNGSGEILTVLGFYFSVPYLFVLGVFILAVFDFTIMKKNAIFWTGTTTIVFVIALYVIQQAFCNVYIVLLHGYSSLAILIGDFIVLGMFIGWKLCPNTCVAYVILFAVKMGLVWGDAWKFAGEPVFGSSGFASLLFVCIPIIQLTLFSPTMENEGISQAFVSRFNIATTHLLHSLDIISFYTFCFRPIEAHNNFQATPAPLRWMMLFFVIVAFCANNLGIPLLFFRQSFKSMNNIIPAKMRTSSILTATQQSVSHRDFHAIESIQQHQQQQQQQLSNKGGLLSSSSNFSMQNENSFIGGDRINNNSNSNSNNNNNDDGGGGGGSGTYYNEHEQMLTFMLVMLVLCDFPFLTTRLTLWSRDLERMDVFAAKNIKAMLDVIMLLTKAREL
jgi:hypothetical protein